MYIIHTYVCVYASFIPCICLFHAKLNRNKAFGNNDFMSCPITYPKCTMATLFPCNPPRKKNK